MKEPQIMWAIVKHTGPAPSRQSPLFDDIEEATTWAIERGITLGIESTPRRVLTPFRVQLETGTVSLTFEGDDE